MTMPLGSLEELLDDLDASLRTDVTSACDVIDALGEIGDPQAIPALRRLVDHDDREIQRSASVALAKTGPQGIEILLQIARNPARKGRQYAVRGLGASGSKLALPVLIHIVRDRTDDRLVRGEAARMLGKIGQSPEIMPTLLDALENSDDEIRSSALMGLGYLHDPAVYGAVAKCVTDRQLRYVAVMALGELGDRRACTLLKSMLANEDPSLRFHAITALGKIGCIEALPTLIELKNQRGDSPLSGVVKAAAESAVKMLEGKKAEG